MHIFNVSSAIGVGFGTAGLGDQGYEVVTMALEAGFRKFDTAEADWWYDQASVGRALSDFFSKDAMVCSEDSEGETVCTTAVDCTDIQDLYISTKIPPWSLTSISDIRAHADASRRELLGFCEDVSFGEGINEIVLPFPLDVYYIHAPACWDGWHPRCKDTPPTVDLRTAWLGMEAAVGIDHSTQRIGLSNVRPDELLDIIAFVRERRAKGEKMPPPRFPDVVQAYADPIRPADELRRLCFQHGIEFVSYSTLGTQHRRSSGNPVLDSSVVQKLAAKYSRSTAEVVLSWALQNGMSVIPRSSKKTHIQELARLLNPDKARFLDPVDLKAIDRLRDAA